VSLGSPCLRVQNECHSHPGRATAMLIWPDAGSGRKRGAEPSLGIQELLAGAG